MIVTFKNGHEEVLEQAEEEGYGSGCSGCYLNSDDGISCFVPNDENGIKDCGAQEIIWVKSE